MLVDRGVDGLLLFGARSDAQTLSAIVHDAIPIVAEDCPAPHANHDGDRYREYRGGLGWRPNI